MQCARAYVTVFEYHWKHTRGGMNTNMADVVFAHLGYHRKQPQRGHVPFGLLSPSSLRPPSRRPPLRVCPSGDTPSPCLPQRGHVLSASCRLPLAAAACLPPPSPPLVHNDPSVSQLPSLCYVHLFLRIPFPFLDPRSLLTLFLLLALPSQQQCPVDHADRRSQSGTLTTPICKPGRTQTTSAIFVFKPPRGCFL